ncbi:uncharacterized protein LOC134738923 [Pongo pygmaeus]|uniref:uncharacterized protein LOC134738923 n=1 Tax=Pongo pygmaeus TaxID=9600 RepID=UPI00300C0DD6
MTTGRVITYRAQETPLGHLLYLLSYTAILGVPDSQWGEMVTRPQPTGHPTDHNLSVCGEGELTILAIKQLGGHWKATLSKGRRHTRARSAGLHSWEAQGQATKESVGCQGGVGTRVAGEAGGYRLGQGRCHRSGQNGNTSVCIYEIPQIGHILLGILLYVNSTSFKAIFKVSGESSKQCTEQRSPKHDCLGEKQERPVCSHIPTAAAAPSPDIPTASQESLCTFHRAPHTVSVRLQIFRNCDQVLLDAPDI